MVQLSLAQLQDCHQANLDENKYVSLSLLPQALLSLLAFWEIDRCKAELMAMQTNDCLLDKFNCIWHEVECCGLIRSSQFQQLALLQPQK
jgi:hypothetical protein